MRLKARLTANYCQLECFDDAFATETFLWVTQIFIEIRKDLPVPILVHYYNIDNIGGAVTRR